MRSGRLIMVLGTVVMTALFIGACSDDDDNPATPPPPTGAEATIGAAGGTLAIPDKLGLEIPPAALAADVDFSADVNTSPPAPPADHTYLSAVYTIEPSGTEFGDPATLTLHYDDGLLGGADESDVVVLADHGGGWEERNAQVDQENDTATIEINQLSDFVVAVETYVLPTGVHAELEVRREFNTGTKAVYYETTDFLEATFESDAAEPARLQADGVEFGTWSLSWDGESGYHYYGNPALGDFLTGGQTYDFVVDGNASVPPLTLPVTVFDVEPVIDNVSWNGTLAMSGFDVTWQGAVTGGEIRLVLDGPGDTGLDLVVPNTGAYTFTEAQLDAVGTGAGTIGLFLEETTPITAPGFDAESYAEMSTAHVVPVTFSREAVIAEFNGTSTPNIAIPDGPSGGGSGAAATDVINVPVTGVVDSVRVFIDANHQYSSDLIIRLRSPEGTEARVMFIGEGGEPNEGGPEGWYPGDYVPKDDLNMFDGEPIGGAWTIDARDYSYQVSGTLVEWRLQIFYAE